MTEPPTVSFHKKISLMMYAFGDNHEPNPETVMLVESIVLKQMRGIVQEALKFSNGNTLEGEELVFLMRHNKHKMRRFVRYLQNKNVRNKLHSIQKNINICADLDTAPKGKLIEFIEKIDETGEFMDLTEVDEVKIERQIRADRISLALDEKKYLEYCKARCVSFKSSEIAHKDLESLRFWINPKKDIHLTPVALDILAYMAYQTVAEIVDYALLVRNDTKSGTDPLQHLPGSYYTAVMFNGAHRYDRPKPDYNTQQKISVNEIKEVMRRVHSPQAGKLNFGGKVPETHYYFAL